jgi:ankyrin repeat protein
MPKRAVNKTQPKSASTGDLSVGKSAQNKSQAYAAPQQAALFKSPAKHKTKKSADSKALSIPSSKQAVAMKKPDNKTQNKPGVKARADNKQAELTKNPIKKALTKPQSAVNKVASNPNLLAMVFSYVGVKQAAQVSRVSTLFNQARQIDQGERLKIHFPHYARAQINIPKAEAIKANSQAFMTAYQLEYKYKDAKTGEETPLNAHQVDLFERVKSNDIEGVILGVTQKHYMLDDFVRLIDIQNNTPCHYALVNKAKGQRILNYFYERAVEVFSGLKNTTKNQWGQNRLHWAVMCNQPITEIQAFINMINMADARGLTPLHIAFEYNITQVASELLDAKDAQVDTPTLTGATLAYMAAKNGNLVLLEKLHTKNANFTLSLKNGFSPIHAAAENGHTDVVDFLLKIGVSVNTKNINNITPLYLAAKNGHFDVVVRLLQQADIEINVADKESGTTAFYMGVQNNHYDVVEVLLKTKKINIDATIPNGLTALICAAYNNDYAMVVILHHAGANHAIIWDGKNAAEHADDNRIRDLLAPLDASLTQQKNL